MNPNRKCKTFQITIHNHECINTPAFKNLFYCYEIGNEPHTHVGLETIELISKKKLLEEISNLNNIEKNKIQIDVHKNFGTVWGYHYGFGDKSPCEPPPIWINKSDEEVTTMVLNRRMHRPLNTCEAVAAKTSTLLGKRPIECLAQGLIHLKGFSGFVRDHALALELLDDDSYVGPTPDKKRHFWYYGPSNTGKSTAAKSHGDYYVVPRNNDWKYYKGQLYIILEEFKGKQPWTIDLLQELCDCDGYTVNTKGGSKLLPRNAVICVTSRDSPDSIFSKEDPEDVSGLFNRFNLINLTTIYYS